MRSSALQPPTELILDINIDGLPLYNSSQKGLWVILAIVTAFNCSQQIFIVGVYLGYNKPDNFFDFIRPFIEEAKNLDNYVFDGSPIGVKIRCIICDAPARNYCLGNKAFSGYYGCAGDVVKKECIQLRELREK